MNAPARSSLPPGSPTTIGRFELRRVLGTGAQATVWLAFDPRLEREVSIKWMNQAAQASPGYDWRREARTVSRLTHPNIVPVFEADLHEGRPFLVFEYVVGDTLAERLSRDGAMPPRAGVAMMLGMLEGLQAAHAAGVVHRDLKPSNVLVDADGRARVMDFGIAGLIHEADGADGLIVGTPGYISPEAARGEAPSPAMDVFSAGVLLIEMLTGERLLRERDAKHALQRVLNEDLQLPAQLAAAVDDVLRAVLRRAIARDPMQRLPTANALHAALSQWINPSATGSETAVDGGNSGTLEFLLRRMRHRTDFPAISESITRIQRIADTDDQSLGSLAAEVSRDVALTNKLLRLVNTAQYSHAGGGSIGTVMRAVALVGFAGIRNMATSLVLLEGMQDKGHAHRLREEYLRSLMAGVLANELAPTARDGEEAFVGAMFQNLGRLLTEYYLPEEAQQIRDLSRPPAGRPAIAETQASISVLGLSFDELGRGVSRHWGLPESLQRCMSRPTGEPPARTSGIERLRWLGLAANEVASALLETEPSRSRARVQVIGERYAKALGLTAKDVLAAVDRSRERLQQTTRALDIVVPGASPARRLLDRPAANAADTADAATIVLPKTETAAAAPRTLATNEPTESAQQLASGIQRITDAMASDGFRLNDVLRMILETMHQALGFRSVVFCLRDAKADALTGRFVIGERAEAMRAAFHVPLRAAPGKDPDLFTSLCSKGLDSVIADATTATIAARLPAWFREQVAAPSFVVLPLMVKGAPFALIYADKAELGAVRFTPQELALLGTLRNQAVMAFRQAGG
ncbi:MAG TPA: HDOD domain-containing protein [Burkholderiaceae bacterium]|nr:HDOD domain-containing protein [Burkholderiaceae bacterium]